VILAFVFTGGGAIGKFLGGHLSDIIGERRVMAAGFFIIAPLFFVAPLLPLFWCVLTLALAGIVFPAVLPAILTTISKLVEPSQRGMADVRGVRLRLHFKANSRCGERCLRHLHGLLSHCNRRYGWWIYECLEGGRTKCGRKTVNFIYYITRNFYMGYEKEEA